MQFKRAKRRGKETSVHETAVSLRDTERACSRAAGAAFRGAQVEPGGPEAHERRPTDGSRRHVCGLTRPHLPPIYLCLPHRPFTRAFIAARAARREQSTDGAPRGPACTKSHRHRRTNRAGIDRKIHHLRAPQSRRTVTSYPILLRHVESPRG